jgi:hypothetical protein
MFKSPWWTDWRLCTTAVIAGTWGICLCAWMLDADWIPEFLFQSVVGLAGLTAAYWLNWGVKRRTQNRVRASAIATASYIPLWHAAVCFSDSAPWLRSTLAQVGTGGLYFIGLLWVVWDLERVTRRLKDQRKKDKLQEIKFRDLVAVRRGRYDEPVETSNPRDAEAWYYGRKSRKLNQSIAAFANYTILFIIAFFVLTNLQGCGRTFEMPAGGGEQQQLPQTVKIKKVIKKKYVINPFSSFSMKIPPIDDVQLQLNDITKHQYTIGYGQGQGQGFAGGNKKGKVRFVRIQYDSGDWDQDFGIAADVNMLVQYSTRMNEKRVAKRTESIRVSQLKNLKPHQLPPFLYLTGQKQVRFSSSEVRILRKFMVDGHCLLFADNGGSRTFHNEFVSLMRQVLPNTRPTPVPLDDMIHRVPYQIPFLPYVAPHGGKEALGWRVDGRLVCYYHPGDIGDAWADDHAGVKPEVYEACYQLGVNVMFYSYAEHAKYLEAIQQK